MNMNKRILVAGGDLRQVFLGDFLSGYFSSFDADRNPVIFANSGNSPGI